jgi:hypothetical protein
MSPPMTSNTGSDVLLAVVLEVNELLRAEFECSLTVGGGPVPTTQAN